MTYLSHRSPVPKPWAQPSIHQVRGESIKRLLFIGVGCQVQALRSVEEDLGLDELYVLGTNCVDNPRNAEAVGEGYVKLGSFFFPNETIKRL